MVQYCARFEKFLAYVDVAKDLDDVIDAFITGLKSTLVGGAGLLRSSSRTWPEFVGAIAQLEWNLGGATSKATPVRRPAGAHVVTNTGGGGPRTKRPISPGFREQLMKFKKSCPHGSSAGCWICGREGHNCFACPQRAEFEKAHPEARFPGEGKGRRV